MGETELTGRTRFRCQSRLLRSPLMVVQVEETVFSADPFDPYDFGKRITRWRDARPEDLLNHSEIIRQGPAMVRSANAVDTGHGIPGTTF